MENPAGTLPGIHCLAGPAHLHENPHAVLICLISPEEYRSRPIQALWVAIGISYPPRNSAEGQNSDPLAAASTLRWLDSQPECERSPANTENQNIIAFSAGQA